MSAASGVLAEISRLRGEGVVSYSFTPAQLTLGQAGGSKKGSIKIALPRPEGAKTLAAYMSVGVVAPGTLRPPVRWRLAVDGSTISREMKPQVAAELDEGYYYKIIYDVRPLLGRKLAERRIHSFIVNYEGAQPITVSDVAIVALYSLQGGRASAYYYSGARVLEPGSVEKLYARLGPAAEGGIRRAASMALIPGAASRLKLAAGGSEASEAQGPGVRVLEVEVPFKGDEVPVALVYEDPGTPIYPSRLVVGDVVVYENSIEGVNVDVRVESVEVGEGSIKITGMVRNRGSRQLEALQVEALTSGLVLSQAKLGALPPGGEAGFTLTHPDRRGVVVVRARWEIDGFPLSRDAVIRL